MMNVQRIVVRTSVVAVALVCLALRPAAADIVHLKKGDVIEGRVTKEGDTYTVETKTNKMSYPADLVDKVVEKKTDVDTFYERAEALTDSNSAGHADLGKWCVSKNMSKYALAEFKKTLAADPKNLTARVGIAEIKAESINGKLRKMSSATVRAMLKKMSPLTIEKIYFDIEARPNSERLHDLSEFDAGFKASLEAKGYKLVDSEESADAVYHVLYKTGVSPVPFEIDGKKYNGINIQSEASLMPRKGKKPIWKGEVFGFTPARIEFRDGADFEQVLHDAAVDDFKAALSRQLPLNAKLLKQRLGASVSFGKGALKKMVADLDALLIDLGKDHIDRDNVLACYGYPQKEEFDTGGINRWIYEDIGLVFEWYDSPKGVVYSAVKMIPGYPGTLYGIEIGQPIAKVKEAFECKLVGENERAGTGTFVVSSVPNVKGVTKIVGGDNQTVEEIVIEFGKPPAEGAEQAKRED